MPLPVRLLVPLSLMMVGCVSQKVETTRTALHVARSLDPAAMEEMKVKTRTGEVATLLVKKRDGRQTFPFVKEEDKPLVNKTSSSEDPKPEEPKERAVPKPVVVSSGPVNTKSEVESKPVSFVPEDTARSLKTVLQPVPAPVYIRSSPVLVKGPQGDPTKNRARSLMTIDSDGIPVIEGVRMPDDESDKVVWRNARVIDGKLTPYDKTQSKHNIDAKPIAEKKKIQSPPAGQWVKLEPVKITAQKDSHNSYKNPWNNVPVIPLPAQEKFKPSELIAVMTTPSSQAWFEYHHPQHTVQIVQEPVSPLPENDRFIRDKILDYIKQINREEMMRRQEPGRESRTLKDSPVQPQIQARVLHSPGASVYPTSLLYSPPSQQPSRVSFEEGVRTPVLQYAHPELGVQPAKVITDTEVDGTKILDRREQALAYFAHDIHADRSPYAFEPGLEDEARVEDFSNNGKRSNSGAPQRPKKTLPYFYADQAVAASSHKDKYYGKYSYNPNPSSYPSYSPYTSAADVRPFWQRMSDSIKEHIQTGMERVSDLTRPVMDPLVEASQKISKNLGLETSGYREFNSLKEKLGVAGTPSVIFPALGLVAGGAALGLGAVAVGRYLDVDMLKRSKDSDISLDDGLSAEHKRAMESVARSLVESPARAAPEVDAKEVVEIVKAVEAAEAEEQKTRRRRSVQPKNSVAKSLSENPAGVTPEVEAEEAMKKEEKARREEEVRREEELKRRAEEEVRREEELKRREEELKRRKEEEVRREEEKERVEEELKRREQEEVRREEEKKRVEEELKRREEELERRKEEKKRREEDEEKREKEKKRVEEEKKRRVEEEVRREEEKTEREDDVVRRDSRRRRSVEPEEAMESMLQSLEVHGAGEGAIPSGAVWSTTPCAKKVFCEVMSLQSDDSVHLTEKKMATYLKMIHPNMVDTVGFHLDDVMRGVRSKDCSPFYCPSVSARDLAEFPGPR